MSDTCKTCQKVRGRYEGPTEEYPLYVYVMGLQKALLHHGNASTPKEALEQLSHITDDAPVAILEVKNCKMFKLKEVTKNQCVACGASDTNTRKCDCTR